MKQQTLAHETVHHLGGKDVSRTSPAGEYFYKKGYANMVGQATFAGFDRMITTPDAVAFAFGFERDDD